MIAFDPAAMPTESVVARARRLAISRGHAQVSAPHVLLVWAGEPESLLRRVGERARVAPATLARVVERALPHAGFGPWPMTVGPDEALAAALATARAFSPTANVDPDDDVLLYHLLRQSAEPARTLRDLGLRCRVADLACAAPPSASTTAAARGCAAGARGTAPSGAALPAFLRDLTAAARAGELPLAVGRERETSALAAIVGQRRVPNAVLVGSAGVGKTAIVEGLAHRIIDGSLPTLDVCALYELDLAALLEDTGSRGSFERRCRELLQFLTSQGRNALLFLDEVHLVMGAGGSPGPDLANLLKSPLARGRIRVIAATTDEEYVRHVEKDLALARRFQRIDVFEPDPAATRAILGRVRAEFADHHGVAIADAALDHVVALAAAHQPDRCNPDKAISLLDLGAGLAALDRAPCLERNHLLRAVASRTDLPAARLLGHDIAGERGLAERLIAPLHGDAAAAAALAGAIAVACRRGVGDSRPFLAVGCTGRFADVALGPWLAQELGGKTARRQTVSLRQCVDRMAVDRLLGAAPGLVGYDDGGQFTEPVRRDPYRTLEVETGSGVHPAAEDILLAALTTGAVSDSRGRRVDYRQSVLVVRTEDAASASRLLRACDVVLGGAGNRAAGE